MNKKIYGLIIAPLISEKSTAQTELSNTYAFKVAKNSNKLQIRDAVEKMFNVKVDSVRTMVTHGEIKRTQRGMTKKPNWKKALVTLKEGQKIEFFQGV